MRMGPFLLAILGAVFVAYGLFNACKPNTTSNAKLAAQMGNSVVADCRATSFGVSSYQNICDGAVWTLRCRDNSVYACNYNKRHGANCSRQSKPEASGKEQ